MVLQWAVLDGVKYTYTFKVNISRFLRGKKNWRFQRGEERMKFGMVAGVECISSYFSKFCFVRMSEILLGSFKTGQAPWHLVYRPLDLLECETCCKKINPSWIVARVNGTTLLFTRVKMNGKCQGKSWMQADWRRFCNILLADSSHRVQKKKNLKLTYGLFSKLKEPRRCEVVKKKFRIFV